MSDLCAMPHLIDNRKLLVDIILKNREILFEKVSLSFLNVLCPSNTLVILMRPKPNRIPGYILDEILK